MATLISQRDDGSDPQNFLISGLNLSLPQKHK